VIDPYMMSPYVVPSRTPPLRDRGFCPRPTVCDGFRLDAANCAAASRSVGPQPARSRPPTRTSNSSSREGFPELLPRVGTRKAGVQEVANDASCVSNPPRFVGERFEKRHESVHLSIYGTASVPDSVVCPRHSAHGETADTRS